MFIMMFYLCLDIIMNSVCLEIIEFINSKLLLSTNSIKYSIIGTNFYNLSFLVQITNLKLSPCTVFSVVQLIIRHHRYITTVLLVIVLEIYQVYRVIIKFLSRINILIVTFIVYT